MHAAEKLTNKKPSLHLAFGATRQGPPATEMLRFGARIGSRHETPALSCPSTYSFGSAKSLIYMSQYFAKSPQHASEKIKPVRMLILGLLLVCFDDCSTSRKRITRGTASSSTCLSVSGVIKPTVSKD